MVLKILFLVALAVAVWLWTRPRPRIDNGKGKGAETAMQQCARCGVYHPADAKCGCERQ